MGQLMAKRTSEFNVQARSTAPIVEGLEVLRVRARAAGVKSNGRKLSSEAMVNAIILEAPTLEVEDAPPEPRGVTLSLGSLTTSGGDFLSFSVHVDQVGAASVIINACEGRRRNLHTLMMPRRDYEEVLGLIQKVNATLNGLSARNGRRRDG